MFNFDFELVPFPQPDGVEIETSEWMVPKQLIYVGGFTLLQRSKIVPGHRLLAFAANDFSNLTMGVELNTGEVLLAGPPSNTCSYVNRNLETFNECVRILYSGYPFKSSLERTYFDESADKFKSQVFAIDPKAVEEAAFWWEIYWSIIGDDYSVQVEAD